MPAQTITYFYETKMELFLWSLPGAIAALTRSNFINWDPAKTQILNAKIHGKIQAPLGTTGQIYFNGEQTHFCDSKFIAGSVDSEVDVSGLLRNGENNVKIELTKFTLSGTGTFSVTLIIEYTGDAPYSTPPKEQLDWVKIVAYAGIAIGAIVAVAYLIKSLK